MKITWELHRVFIILSHFTRSAAENREMQVGELLVIHKCFSALVRKESSLQFCDGLEIKLSRLGCAQGYPPRISSVLFHAAALGQKGPDHSELGICRS